MAQPANNVNDIDEKAQESYTVDDVVAQEKDMPIALSPQPSKGDRTLKWGIIASCVLHGAFLAWLVIGLSAPPTKSVLRPGEQATPVRLVEFTEPPPPEEKPPPEASATSDRNHTAAQEKLPKRPPGSGPLLGHISPPDGRMSAFSPPSAPEVPEETETSPKEQPREAPKPDTPKTEKLDPPPKQDQEAIQPRTRIASRRDSQLHSLLNRKLDLRPTPEEIARALSGSGGAEDFFPEGSVDEAVVDLNTREDRYFSYLLHLKRKIEGVWSYPAMAAKSGLGGELTVEFLIARNGKLLGARLLDSSGSKLLDQTALSAIRTAAPYHPFPSRLKVKRLRVRARFIYVTQRFFRRVL